MICHPCAAAGDLFAADLALNSENETGVAGAFSRERLSNVVGRPYAGTVVRRAMRKLHNRCPGCDCQHRAEA